MSREIDITLDVQAILDEDLEATGAMAYYHPADSSEEIPSETQAGTPDAP
ncbi:MAG: hypothetical protein M3350_09845 [Actinomycetota bacterium]|nr:hypothetical protein [Actinomycetota bacterium]